MYAPVTVTWSIEEKEYILSIHFIDKESGTGRNTIYKEDKFQIGRSMNIKKTLRVNLPR